MRQTPGTFAIAPFGRLLRPAVAYGDGYSNPPVPGDYTALNMEWVEADARGPPSQLQEALKEITKVDAENSLPTWVPKTRVNMTKRRIPGIGLRVDHVFRTTSCPHSNNNE
jgi:hypothetical protein